ncbi:MAG: hypothetical protein V7754_00750 [Halioglobus sp.]
MMWTQCSYRLRFGIVLLLTLVPYAFALQAPLFFDDLPNLVNNPVLQIDGRVFDEWRTAAFSSGSGALRRPVSMLSFALNHAFFGEFTPATLKAVNLAIHLTIGLLIYLLAEVLFRAPALRPMDSTRRHWAALAAAAIWLLHPLHVSTVLYSVQRMAQLSALFVVLGLWVFSRYRLRWAHSGATVGEIAAAAIWLLIITVFATLSKENGALLPWLLLVVETALFRGQWWGVRRPSLVKLGWLALLLPILLIGLIFLFRPELFTAGYQLRDFSLVERLMTQCRVLWLYLGWLVIPDISAMGFQHDDIALSRGLLQPYSTVLALAGWVLAVIAAFFLRYRYPMLLFAVLFFLVGHVMESTVLALEMVFEHRNYLPGIGICLLMASLLTSEKLWQLKINPVLPLVGILCVFLVLLAIRCMVWSDAFLMARTNVINHPDSPRANYFYAEALQDKHKQGAEEGLSEGEIKALVVAMRQQFFRVHELAPTDTSALVSLYYTDAQYFPDLGKQLDWFSVLERALRARVLQASDFVSLSVLVDCVGNGGCQALGSRVESLLDDLIVKYPREERLYLVKYDFLVFSGAPVQQRIALLEKASVLSPEHASLQYLLVLENGKNDDIAGMYEVARQWLAHDGRRWDLPLIKRLFVFPEASQ